MIPENWSQITIGQYQATTAIMAKELSDIEQRMELAYLFAGEDASGWTLAKLKSETNKILSFLGHLPESKMYYRFEIDSRTFSVNPIVQTMTGGQYIDLTTLLRKPEETINNLHNIMAVIATEGSYRGYVENGKLFQEKLTMDKVFPLSAFFLRVGKNYLKIIESSLIRETKKMKREERRLKKESRTTHTAAVGIGI